MAKGTRMEMAGQQVINNLLNEWGGEWQSVAELAKLPEGDTRLRLLQQLLPDQDIHGLSRDELVNHLWRDQWQQLQADDFASPAVAESIFRAVLYLGLADAVRLAQQVVKLPADGIMGPQTLHAINEMDENEFYSRYSKEVINFVNMNKSAAAENEMPFSDAELKAAQTSSEAMNKAPFMDQSQQTAANQADKDEQVQDYHVRDVIADLHISEDERRSLHEFIEELGNNLRAEADLDDTALAAMRKNLQERIEKLSASAEEKRTLTEYLNLWLDQNVLRAQTGSDHFNVEAIAKKSTSDLWTIEDRLGYASYAQAIAKLIVEGKAQPPLTVSIQAPWGQGKTSLMRMIKHKLEHGIDEDKTQPASIAAAEEPVPGTQTKLNHLKHWISEESQAAEAMLPQTPGTIPCVWFNPLYFQDSNQVWSGLAHAILHQLAEKLPNQLQRERFWFRLQLSRIDTHAVRRDIHKLILERWLPKGLVWAGILLVMLLYSLTNTQLGEFLQQHVFVQLSPIFGGIGHLVYQWLNKNKDWALNDKLTRYIREPDYARDMGRLHLVDHDLDRALQLLLGKDGRLVVFIDDLDRCAPDTVNDILLAINQFISVQHRKLYFILGMDTHMVAMAIETASEKQAATYNKNRHTSKGYGWRFMEKFVQLPFFIPRIQPQDAEKFLDNLLRETPAPKVEKAAIEDLKTRIAGSNSLPELQDVVKQFKREHRVEVLPEVDASVASKMIDITSDQTGETLNKLVAAAMTDLELNPREMKRFLNVARLLFIRLDHNEDVSSDEHMLKVVRASHLILNWPQCLRWLQGNARSYTVKGVKTDPVENLENLFNNPGIDNFEKWSKTIEDTWGKTVAQTVAQPDFYTFTRRIHEDPPNLQDIFKAQIF